MTTTHHRRHDRRSAAAALAVLLGCSGCGGLGHPKGRQATPNALSTEQTGSPPRQPIPRQPAVIPSESPTATRPTVALDPPLPAVVPPRPSPATRTPLDLARAWTIAANSSSYRHRSPGEWTTRARPLVTGSEAAAEAAQRRGGGGSTWTQIQAGRCVTQLRDLVAFIPSDAPSGPDAHVVYVAAHVALSCATGTVYLSDFAAQLTVQRVANRWLVTSIRH